MARPTRLQVSLLEPAYSHAEPKFTSNVAEDSDGDLLPDYLERFYGTDVDVVDSDSDGLSDYEELNPSSSYELFFQKDVSWPEAKAIAEAKGGYLAAITSEQEQLNALEFITAESRSGRGFYSAWIGASDAAQEGDWQWVTGEKWEYENWHNGEQFWFAGESESEDYLQIVSSSLSGPRGLWNDLPDAWSRVNTNASFSVNYFLVEYGYTSDPNNSDTDGDGISDGLEADFGTNPNLPSYKVEVEVPEVAQGSASLSSQKEFYDEGVDVTVVATPSDGFAFSSWQGDAESTNNPLTVSVSGNLSLQAVFKPLWPLFLESVDGGRIVTNPGQERFIEGSRVSLLGVADEGYRFDRWLGSLSGNESSATLLMDEPKSVSAVFVEHRAPVVATPHSISRIKVGDSFTLEAEVSGTAPLSLQWSKDGTPLLGETGASLSIAEADAMHSGLYSLSVVNDAGEVSKELLDFGVLQPLVLVSQPSEVVQMAQSLAVLEVETSGDGPLAYEWSKDGESLGFSPVSALTFESLSESDAGLYTVEITSPVSMVASEPITLTVTPFVEAPVVTKELQPQSVAIGSSLFLTVANSGQSPFNYTWSKDGEEIVSTKDPFLLLPNAQSEQSGLYSLKISNPGGEATSGPVEIRILQPAAITSQPVGVQVMQTLPFSLNVIVEGGGELTYQWFKDGEEVVDATSNVYSVPEADFGQTGLYKVVIDSELGPIESDIVSVLVTPLIFAPEIIAGPRSQKVDLGESVSLTVVVGGTKPFEFIWFHEGNVIEGENGTFLIIEVVAEGDLGSYTVEVKNSQGSVLFSNGALLSLRQPVVITSEPDDQRVALGALLELSFQIVGDPPYSIHWEKDVEIIPEVSEAVYAIASVSDADAGTYQMVITSRGQEIRSRLITVDVLIPPAITGQPKDQELVEGQSLELTVEVTGSLPMTFKLIKAGTVLFENQTGVFSFASVGADLAGQLAIEASNEAGSAATVPFSLTLTTAPPVIVSQPTGIVIAPGGRLEISVEATGGGIGYRWFKDGTLIDGAIEEQLVIDPATSDTSADYFAVLSNSRGVITSNPISVRLSSRLRIVLSDGQLTIEIIGGSGGEVWNVERSTDLVSWELVEKVVLEMEEGFASGVLTGIALDGGSSFFRATR